MNNVVSLDSYRSDTIDVSKLSRETPRLSPDLIAPASEPVSCELAPEHAAEPIKSMDDIIRVSEYLVSCGRWRDNMLFIVGINFGLRASDLRELRFANLINDNLTFKETFAVFERKTRNTRKRKKNRYITINDAVVDSITLYLEHTPGVCLSDYMFRSESGNGRNANCPLTVRSIDRILKGVADDLGLRMHMSTHTLRKTFAYHQMLMSHNDPRKLLLLQKMMNHSSPAQTLDYIGLTAEEMEDAYRKLNLGSKTNHYLLDSSIGETDAVGDMLYA